MFFWLQELISITFCRWTNETFGGIIFERFRLAFNYIYIYMLCCNFVFDVLLQIVRKEQGRFLGYEKPGHSVIDFGWPTSSYVTSLMHKDVFDNYF